MEKKSKNPNWRILILNSEWKEYRLGDVAEIVGGGTPSTKIEIHWNGAIPWITPKDLSNHSSNYISRGERNITLSGLKNSSAKILPINTVLLSTRAPVGYLAIASNELATNQGFRSLIVDDMKISNVFLFYLLKKNVEYLKSMSSGTTFGELSGSTLKNISFSFPPLPEQKRIAEILSSLDDKIEINNKMNKNLEEMAQAIFKQWFVDFEYPDENRNPYKSSGGKMIQSELGEIPEGWSVGKIAELIELSYGKALQENLRTGFGNPVYGSNGVVGYHNEYLVEAPCIVIGRKGTLGKVIYCYDNFWPIDTTFYIKSKTEKSNYIFEYYMLRSIDFKEFNSDSAVPGLNRNVALSHSLIIPLPEVVLKFNSIMQSIFSRLKNNIDENETLTKTRESLLPKLMSGEMRI